MSPPSRSEQLVVEAQRGVAAKLDRTFAALFLAQWLVAVGYVASATARRPGDLFAATVVGAAIAAVPTSLVVWRSGASATRHAIAVAQMLYGALFVHLAGGGLGTPRHVFVSLAVIALYRSPELLATAAGVGALASFALAGVAPQRWAESLVWIVAAAVPLAVVARRAQGDLAARASELARAEASVPPGEGARPTAAPPEHVGQAAPSPERAFTSAPPAARALPAPSAPEREPDGAPAWQRALPNAPAILEVPVVITDPHALGNAPTLRPRALSELLIYSDFEGDDGMGELLEGFVGRLRDTARLLEETARALTDERAPEGAAATELELLAHRVRGAAASYGFPSIGEAAAAVEEAARTGVDVGPRVSALAGLCRRARARRFVPRAA